MVNREKYENEIIAVDKLGLKCPPDNLSVPKDFPTYRFVFEDKAHIKNHKPAGKINPKRVLSEKDERKCFLYSLSCFTNKEGAETFFFEVKKNIKNFEKSVGNWIYGGIINDRDGLMSTPEENAHFELFEFTDCDLSAKFEAVKKLI